MTLKSTQRHGEEALIMESGTSPKAICVLGMHRSGTSVFSRAINLMGAYLGEPSDLLSPTDENREEFKRMHPDNPVGFWEHLSIMDLHDRLLARLDSRWDTTVPLPRGWHLSEDVAAYRAELVELVKVNFSGHQLWAWKDPRTSILLALWKDVLLELGVELACVFVVRNPLDVARSLGQRNGFSHDKGFGVWFNYHMAALPEIVDIPTAFVSYDNLLADWEEALGACTARLGID